MKIFSKYINEHCDTADVNQGNSLINSGVSNHLTPVGNILTNVRNLFTVHMGIVASIGEDGISIKLNSSNFISKEEIRKALYNYEIMRGTCLANYITSQGLDSVKAVNLGQFYVVYFSPSDIKTAEPAAEPEQCNYPCEDLEMINNIIKESGEDEELKDITKEKIHELITSKDKVKAAKQLELIIGQEMELPREFYFAGVKAQNGEESIALRWKYQKKVGKNQSAEITKSLMNIYDEGKDGIFVPDFDKNSMFQLPDEVKKMIENVIEILGGKKTNDPATFSLSEIDDKDDKDDKNDTSSNDDTESDDNNSNDTGSNDDIGSNDDTGSNDENEDAGSDDKNNKKKKNKKSDDSDDLLG